MPRHANQTSFKKGHQNPDARKKQSETLKRLYQEGKREPPGRPWSDERKQKYRQLAGSGVLDRVPIGSSRVQSCGGFSYRMVKAGPGRKGWRYEHRLVMEEHLGRILATSEHVHHRNGDTLDNRLENLEVLSSSKHTARHSPTRAHPKGPRLAPGQWSKKHECCSLCGLTTSPHASRGKCNRCNERERRAKDL